MLCLLFVSLGMTLVREQQFSAETERFVNQDLVRIRLLTEINEHASDAGRKLLVLMASPRETRVLAYTEIAAANRQLDAAMQLLPALLEGGMDNPHHSVLVEALSRYRVAFQDTADLIESDAFGAAREPVFTRTDFELSKLVAATQNLDHTLQDQLTERLSGLHAEQTRDKRVLIGLAVSGALISAMLAFWVVRDVAMPLRHAARAARRVADGDYDVRLAARPDGDEVGDIANAMNQLVDGVRDREQMLRRMVDLDPLTGLSRRDHFLDTQRPLLDAKLGTLLVCFDIERLKAVNALLGFDAGDAAIRSVAERVAGLVGSAGRAARLGGGTFIACISGETADALAAAAGRFQREMEHRLDWRNHVLDVSVTAGLAHWPTHGESLALVVGRAEQALYEAKRLRLRHAVYQPALEAERLSHLSLLSELQAGIAQGQLVPFLQGKYDLASGQVVGAEALVRWRHPQRGWISPGDFIPFAERTGRITQITQSILSQCVALLARHPSLPALAVNIAAQDLHADQFPGQVQALLTEHDVDPRRLQLEVTESGLLEGGEEPVRRLRMLSELGVQIAIDDFGTGQSSLAYLQRLPVQTLKIDRSFVQAADLDVTRTTMLGAILQLSRALGLKTVAEGVETQGELTLLKSLGCDQAQGFLIARPVPVDQFLSLHLVGSEGAHGVAVPEQVVHRPI
jgi:diguanylate cyclase (GGDEF)-like protein